MADEARARLLKRARAREESMTRGIRELEARLAERERLRKLARRTVKGLERTAKRLKRCPGAVRAHEETVVRHIGALQRESEERLEHVRKCLGLEEWWFGETWRWEVRKLRFSTPLLVETFGTAEYDPEIIFDMETPPGEGEPEGLERPRSVLFDRLPAEFQVALRELGIEWHVRLRDDRGVRQRKFEWDEGEEGFFWDNRHDDDDGEDVKPEWSGCEDNGDASTSYEDN
jgi:hypothetical protein